MLLPSQTPDPQFASQIYSRFKFPFYFALISNFTRRRLRGDLLHKFQKRPPRALKFYGQALQAEFYRILKSVNFAAKFYKISRSAKFRCAPLCLRRFLIRVLRAKSLNSRRASRPFLDARSVNLRAELFALVDFLIRKFARRAFYFNSLSICNLRARFAAARTTLLYTAARLYAFFSLFCMSPYPSSTFSRARPVFKFCRFARSIRSGYERTCA